MEQEKSLNEKVKELTAKLGQPPKTEKGKVHMPIPLYCASCGGSLNEKPKGYCPYSWTHEYGSPDQPVKVP